MRRLTYHPLLAPKSSRVCASNQLAHGSFIANFFKIFCAFGAANSLLYGVMLLPAGIACGIASQEELDFLKTNQRKKNFMVVASLSCLFLSMPLTLNGYFTLKRLYAGKPVSFFRMTANVVIGAGSIPGYPYIDNLKP